MKGNYVRVFYVGESILSNHCHSFLPSRASSVEDMRGLKRLFV